LLKGFFPTGIKKIFYCPPFGQGKNIDSAQVQWQSGRPLPVRLPPGWIVLIHESPNNPIAMQINVTIKMTMDVKTSNFPRFSLPKKKFAKPNSCAYICNRLAAQ